MRLFSLAVCMVALLSACASTGGPTRYNQPSPPAEPEVAVRVGDADSVEYAAPINDNDTVRDPIVRLVNEENYQATARDVKLLLNEVKRLSLILHRRAPELRDRLKDYDVSELKSMISDLDTLADLNEARAVSMLERLQALEKTAPPAPDRPGKTTPSPRK